MVHLLLGTCAATELAAFACRSQSSALMTSQSYAPWCLRCDAASMLRIVSCGNGNVAPCMAVGHQEQQLSVAHKHTEQLQAAAAA
jgi:hypothetical protein